MSIIVHEHVMFLCLGNIDTVNLQSFDISVIANMVKKYLRELRDPVIPENSYSSYMDAASMYFAAYRFLTDEFLQLLIAVFIKLVFATLQ